MQYILSITVIFIIGGQGYTQPLHQRHWTHVTLPIDSLYPYTLYFHDSLNGSFTGFTVNTSYDTSIVQFHNHANFYLFQTTDGGKRWELRDDGITIGKELIDFRGPELYYHGVFYVTPNYQYLQSTGLPFNGRQLWYSSSSGNQWNVIRDDLEQLNLRCVAALGSSDIVYYNEADGYFYRSYDRGKTISSRLGDSLYINTIRPDTVTQSSPCYQQIAHPSLLFIDPFTWIAIANIYSKVPCYPDGLIILTTTTAGKTWQRFIHHDLDTLRYSASKALGFQFQYEKESKTLYYFTDNGDGRSFVEGGYNNSLTNGGVPFTKMPYTVGGINFIYSTDLGRSWEVQRSLASVRRAYEVTASKEIWHTVIGNPKPTTLYSHAYIIARSTDNGNTWEFDSTTLWHFEQRLDGRIITASDPRHIWIAARSKTGSKRSYLFRYDANEQPKSVEEGETYFYRGGYGLHYTLNPNPSNETTMLQLHQKLLPRYITAVDILGIERPVPAQLSGSEAEIDVRSLPIGHYTLRVRHNWGTSVIPLVVMR